MPVKGWEAGYYVDLRPHAINWADVGYDDRLCVAMMRAGNGLIPRYITDFEIFSKVPRS